MSDDLGGAAAETEADPTGQLEKLLGIGGRIIAPATLISTLLFYFGYVSSRAQYDYFGLDVDVIGLSTQDYVMRSPQPLLVPVLLLTLLVAAASVAQTLLRRYTVRPRGVLLARRLVLGGGVLLALGVGLLFSYPLLGGRPWYALTTPLVLSVGGAAGAAGTGTLRWLDRRRPGRPRPGSGVGAGVVVALWFTVAAGLFWATATVAQWSGRGLAIEQARTLDTLPSVVLDSRQRLLVPVGAGVGERDLGAAVGDSGYRYRYWNLRLLIQGHGTMFLVPAVWSPSATTLLVPLDDQVRVQFQFRDDPP